MSTSKRFGRLSRSWMQRSEDHAGQRRKRQKDVARYGAMAAVFQSWQLRNGKKVKA